MRSATASSFEEAAKHERELNERQRQVLDLLVQGRTNGEIAEALRITLDGATWNVSEILGKLGLSSREEAAGTSAGQGDRPFAVWQRAYA